MPKILNLLILQALFGLMAFAQQHEDTEQNAEKICIRLVGKKNIADGNQKKFIECVSFSAERTDEAVTKLTLRTFLNLGYVSNITERITAEQSLEKAYSGNPQLLISIALDYLRTLEKGVPAVYAQDFSKTTASLLKVLNSDELWSLDGRARQGYRSEGFATPSELILSSENLAFLKRIYAQELSKKLPTANHIEGLFARAMQWDRKKAASNVHQLLAITENMENFYDGFLGVYILHRASCDPNYLDELKKESVQERIKKLAQKDLGATFQSVRIELSRATPPANCRY